VSDPARILVVDDERPIRRALEMTLSRAGYRVDAAASAAEALTQAALQPPDMVVLDLMLPDGDGAQVCRELREWSAAPVLLVSVVEDEAEKVRALDAGADDYITKPFGVDELLARVRALLRRSSRDERGDSVIELDGLTVDLPRRRVMAADGEVRLTPIEFDLLKTLAVADGRVLTHRTLLRTVWGPGYADESQVLRVHTARLRDKLEAHGLPRDLIETVTGVGYRVNRRDGA
jgi:two-component system KDP operon response regulator KdpE